MGWINSAIADFQPPPVPTTLPPLPSDLPPVPTTIPSVPTIVPSVPTILPTPDSKTNPNINIYTFSGFKLPIRFGSTTTTNTGKSIRFAWTLTDKSGETVKNPTVVLDRFYREIDCSSDTVTSNINPMGVRLTNTIWNKGRKDLEFSWKIPNLKKSCLLFSVVFDDGQTASAKFFVKR
jgi:hypothetical protein